MAICLVASVFGASPSAAADSRSEAPVLPSVVAGIVVADASTLAEVLDSDDYKPQTQGAVLRLYRAFFNREPDVDGAKYWLNLYTYEGYSLDQIADFFTLSDEFRNAYDGTTDEAFVAAVYGNVLGRDFDQAGYDYWLELLKSGSLTRSGVVRWITQNAEFVDANPYRSALYPGKGIRVVGSQGGQQSAHARILATLLSDLGYDSTDPAFYSLGLGGAATGMYYGEIDYYPDMLQPDTINYPHQLEEPAPDDSPLSDHIRTMGIIEPVKFFDGLVVTKSVAVANEITSLQQINDDPELVALFDHDGNGLAEIENCRSCWIIQVMLEKNGWTNFEVTPWFPRTFEDTVARTRHGEPVIQLLRSYQTGTLPVGVQVLYLSMGPDALPCEVEDGCGSPEQGVRLSGAVPLGEFCTDNPCWTWDEYYYSELIARPAFVDANPAAARLMQLVSIPGVLPSSQTDEASIADAWLADPKNQALIQSWLDEARQAGL